MFNISFSHVRTPRTQKPNVHRKKFVSEILGQEFNILVSIKALRCIYKAGGFDRYILDTKEKNMNSKFGMHLRELMQKKLKDPSFAIPYIKGQAKRPVQRTKDFYTNRRLPSIYIPAHVKANVDLT